MTNSNSQQESPTALKQTDKFTSQSVYNDHPRANPDEINLLEYLYVLVKKKWWIIGAAVLGLMAGLGVALLKGPSFSSEALIAPKEAEDQSMPSFAGLGTLGGLVSAKISSANSPGLDKIKLILDSRKFNAELIDKYNLLPLIYKNLYPADYKEWFDTTHQTWRDSFPYPDLMSVGYNLKTNHITTEINIKNNTLLFKIETKDSLFTEEIIKSYLEYLNTYIQESVLTQAKDNVSYLENQLITISDPLLREKLQTMIASELEKSMLVSKEAFRVIDPKFTSKQFSEKLFFPAAFSLGFMIMSILFITFLHVMNKSVKSEHDEILLKQIKKELTKF